MAKDKPLMTPVPNRTDKAATRPTAAADPAGVRAPAPAADRPTAADMPFGAANYRLMLIGVVLILLGFVLMSLDQEPFGFGILGLTLGPLVVLSGFIVEFFAILRTPKK